MIACFCTLEEKIKELWPPITMCISAAVTEVARGGVMGSIARPGDEGSIEFGVGR